MAHTRHSKKTNSKVTWQSQYLFNPQTALYALGAFLMCVFFMGGGARDDIQSLIILRPFAILCIAFALIYKIEMKIKWQSFPLNLLFLLTLLMIVQLIPLPPELWTQLPQRQIFADIANISAIEQPWRPLSLSPSKTWNSLFSLTVPFAAMALFMNLQPHDRRRAMLIIIALLALSAAWGILQSLGSARGPLYLYRITNHGVAVGLFANRNHQSFMLASLILFLGWYSFSLQHREKINPLKIIAVMGGIFMLIPLIFITGSRAGLILMVPALFAALYFFYSGGKSKRKRRPDHSKKLGKSIKIMDRVKAHSNTIILFAIAFAIVSLAIGSVIFSRSLAFDRLFADGGLEGLRLKATPILLMMASEYMPFALEKIKSRQIYYNDVHHVFSTRWCC